MDQLSPSGDAVFFQIFNLLFKYDVTCWPRFCCCQVFPPAHSAYTFNIAPLEIDAPVAVPASRLSPLFYLVQSTRLLGTPWFESHPMLIFFYFIYFFFLWIACFLFCFFLYRGHIMLVVCLLKKLAFKLRFKNDIPWAIKKNLWRLSHGLKNQLSLERWRGILCPPLTFSLLF